MAQSVIAVSAQESANPAGGVIMINGQAALRCAFLFANFTYTVLFFIHFSVLCGRDPISLYMLSGLAVGIIYPPLGRGLFKTDLAGIPCLSVAVFVEFLSTFICLALIAKHFHIHKITFDGVDRIKIKT